MSQPALDFDRPEPPALACFKDESDNARLYAALVDAWRRDAAVPNDYACLGMMIHSRAADVRRKLPAGWKVASKRLPNGPNGEVRYEYRLVRLEKP